MMNGNLYMHVICNSLTRTKLGNGLLSGDYSKPPQEGVDERLLVSTK